MSMHLVTTDPCSFKACSSVGNIIQIDPFIIYGSKLATYICKSELTKMWLPVAQIGCRQS